MPFGFDASLILGARPAPANNGPSLADLLQMRRSVDAQDQAQQQQATLASIYRQGASNPAALGQALLSGGFGPQAAQWNAQQSETEARAASAQRALQEAVRSQTEILGRAFRDVKDQPGLDAARAAAKQLLGATDEHLAMIPSTYAGNEAFIERLAQLGAPLAKQLSPAEEEARAARAGYERAKTVDLEKNGGRRPMDPLKRENLSLQTQKLKKELANTGDGGRPLPPSTLSELAAFDVAERQLDELFDKFDKSGLSGAGGKLAGRVSDELGRQSGPAAEYEADAKAVRQGVGTILEGGKLAAGDEDKYKKMLAQPGDSAEVAKNKRAALKKYLRDLKASRIKALRDGGYQVPNMPSAPAAKPVAPGRVRVTNGTQTFDVEPANLKAAEADGFRRVQ